MEIYILPKRLNLVVIPCGFFGSVGCRSGKEIMGEKRQYISLASITIKNNTYEILLNNSDNVAGYFQFFLLPEGLNTCIPAQWSLCSQLIDHPEK